MSTPLSANQFLSLVRSAGVSYMERPGWMTHNRRSSGLPWGPVHGVMIHHTGDYASERAMVDQCWDGYSGLPGPLCQGVIGKTGQVYLTGWGRCNHAGTGDPRVLEHVITEEFPLPRPRYANGEGGGTDGNARFYGFELINRGDGEDPWPPEQVRAAARVAAGICRRHGWTERSVIGHKEWQRGKIDPSFDMTEFRRTVAAYLSA